MIQQCMALEQLTRATGEAGEEPRQTGIDFDPAEAGRTPVHLSRAAARSACRNKNPPCYSGRRPVQYGQNDRDGRHRARLSNVVHHSDSDLTNWNCGRILPPNRASRLNLPTEAGPTPRDSTPVVESGVNRTGA